VRLDWQLTGRTQELRHIEAVLADPGAPGVIISGAAGVGKSRLARTAVDHAAAKRYEARWVTGTTAARALPLGAFSVLAGPAMSESIQLVQVVRGVIDAVTTGAPGVPVIVGVDDAHLLDELSTRCERRDRDGVGGC